MKMSDENIQCALQQLSGFEPSDIDCDDFDIAVNDDQFASMSIVRLAKLAADSQDRLTKENADLISVLSNAVSGWDYEEIAHHCGVDVETAARVIEILKKNDY